MKDQISQVVRDTISEFNKMYDHYQLGTNDDDTLYGKGSMLDSIGLVSLIVEIECRIEEELGVQVDLATDKAFSEKRSPFATMGRLIEYIVQLTGDSRHV